MSSDADTTDGDIMSRRRKKKQQPTEEKLGDDGLEMPFPSCPSRPPKFCIYCRYPFDAPAGRARRFVWTFRAAYAAKRFVDTILEGRKFKWRNDHTIQTTCGIEIRAMEADHEVGEKRYNDLERVMDYEYASTAEEEWVIPQPHANTLATFLRPFGDVAPPRKDVGRVAPPAPRASRDGLVTVGQICERLKVEPREGRSILRRQKVDQPDAGWAWPADEAAKIEALIAKHAR